MTTDDVRREDVLKAVNQTYVRWASKDVHIVGVLHRDIIAAINCLPAAETPDPERVMVLVRDIETALTWFGYTPDHWKDETQGRDRGVFDRLREAALTPAPDRSDG